MTENREARFEFDFGWARVLVTFTEPPEHKPKGSDKPDLPRDKQGKFLPPEEPPAAETKRKPGRQPGFNPAKKNGRPGPKPGTKRKAKGLPAQLPLPK